MSAQESTELPAQFTVENVGGIESATVSISPGVSVLVGRNATNRTSFLQAIMAVMGSDNVTLKGDASRGQIELSLGDEEYTRILKRTDTTVTSDGSPYLDESSVADRFAFLLEANETRRAVARGDDLHDIIMAPVDTEAIKTEIDTLERKKKELESELKTLQQLKKELPELEQKCNRIEGQIEEKRAELAEKEAEIEEADNDVDETRKEKQEVDKKLNELHETRSELEDIRYRIESEKESIESLKSERREMQTKLDELPETPMADQDDLSQRITRLRQKKQKIESKVNELQNVIQFNESILNGDDHPVLTALQDNSDGGGSVTDQLTESGDTVTCWTCGSEVQRNGVKATIDTLRNLHKANLDEIRDIENELDELTSVKRNLQQKQREREEVEQSLSRIEDELIDRQSTLDDLQKRRNRLMDEVESLENTVDELESDAFSNILKLHKEANQFEHEIDRLEDELTDIENEIESIETEIEAENDLEAKHDQINEELTDLRTRIDQIEKEAIEEFNEHMDAVLDILEYKNIERIWIERIENRVKQGRQKVEQTVFELHVVRSTQSGATYEDTVDHLSESEREVTGLIFALAGYLVHNLYDNVPFMLLDSLEAIDSQRIADLVDYLSGYAEYLVVALLPEDAAALDDNYTRVTEI